MACLVKKVWDNTMPTLNTKIMIYQVCVLNTLLYGSETWTLYSHQERRLNVFHMHNLRWILDIIWQDRVTNASILSQTGIPNIYSPSSPRDACAGSDTCTGNKTVASQRTYWWELTPREPWRHVASPEQISRQRHRTALVGHQGSRMTSIQQREVHRACGSDKKNPQATDLSVCPTAPNNPAAVYICRKCQCSSRCRMWLCSHSRCCSSTDSVQNTVFLRDRRLPSAVSTVAFVLTIRNLEWSGLNETM